MSAISDLKLAYWEDATSKTGTLADLEMAFLEGATSKTGTLDDLRSIYFGTDGPLPFFQRMTGGEGTLADLEYQFYSSFDSDTAELLNIPGLESIWLSSDVNGVGASLPDDGDAIGLWKDLSSKKRDLSQATMANKPLWRKAGVNLLPIDIANPSDTSGWMATGAASISWDSAEVTPYGTGTVKVNTTTSAFSGAQFDLQLPNVDIRTFSIWVRAAAGTGINIAPDALGTNIEITATGNWQMVSLTSPFPMSATGSFFVRNNNSSAPDAPAIWVGRCQLELGSTATPWLPPGNAQGMQFDGVNDVLQTVPLAGFPETTVYAVASVLGGANTYRALFNHRYYFSPATRGVILYTEDTNKFSTWGGVGTSWKLSGYPNGTADSARHVWSARFSPSSLKLYVDGDTSTNDPGAGFTPVTAADNRSIYIGAGNDLGNQFFMPGLIHDVIICSQAHDDATRQKVETILMKRNGITP